MENKRKKRLLEIKDEEQQGSQSTGAAPGVSTDTDNDPSQNTEGDDINNFLKQVAERKKARKQQLEIVHDFFENPAAYGVDTDIIPSSTTEDEIDTRKKELQHKIDLLHSVLKALEGEMELLCQVTVTDENGDVTAGLKAGEEQLTILEKKAAAAKKAPRNRSTAKKKAVTKKKVSTKKTVKKTVKKSPARKK